MRDRRPALAALAVLLIVGGALASGMIALRSGQRADYLVITQAVEPGQQIAAKDLGVARIAGTGASALPAAMRAQVIGKYASTRIPAGTLLTKAMYDDTPTLQPGLVGISAVLQPEQAPADLRAGAVVAVYVVPPANSGVETTLLVPAATVDDVFSGGSGRSDLDVGAVGTQVKLIVPADAAAAVTTAAAQKSLVLVELPAGTAPSTRGSGESAPAVAAPEPSASAPAGGSGNRSGPASPGAGS